MENATKALLIAGGILISIRIISLFLTMYNRMSSFQKKQESEKEFAQISTFNSGFEAYNKKVMYGTDIISLMNKAIENNKTKSASTGDYNFVNIKLTIKKEYQASVRVENLVKKQTTSYYGIEAAKIAAKCGITITDIKLEANKTYSLGEWKNGTEDLVMKDKIIEFFLSDKDDHVIERKIIYGTTGDDSDNAIYYINSALTNFKMSRFKCVSTQYNDNGRIKEMSFEEYSN